MDTDWAILLCHEFENGGYAGLTRVVQQMANTFSKDPRVTPEENYEIVADDGNVIHFMM